MYICSVIMCQTCCKKEEVVYVKGGIAAVGISAVWFACLVCVCVCVLIFLSTTNSIITMTRLLLGVVLLGNLCVCVTAQGNLWSYHLWIVLLVLC